MRCVARTFLLILVVALAGCRAAPIYNAADVPFATSTNPQLSLDEYRNAIIRAGAERGWTFEDQGPGHLVGSLAVRAKHFAKVDVRFNTQSFSITHLSSQNLNYDAARQEIHPNYNAWVNNLQADIQRELVRVTAS